VEDAGSTLTRIRGRYGAVAITDAALEQAISRLLAYERSDTTNYTSAHAAMRDVAAALVASQDARDRLALALGLDPLLLAQGAGVDNLVPALLQHE